MDKIKIAVIGCGKQATKHVKGLRRMPGVDIVLADTNPVAAKELGEKEGLICNSEPSAVMEDPSVDAVVICTPTPSHLPLMTLAVESGKDFFCEKPLCETLEEADFILGMVEKHNRIGMVGYVYRFVPAFEVGYKLFEDLLQLGESLVLGKIVAANLRLGGRGSHQVWKHLKNGGGGVINEMMVHMIDLAIWYFGAVTSAQFLAHDILRPVRKIQGREVEVDAEDYAVIRLRMESGVEVLCQADLVTPAFTQFAEVQGENGTFMGSIQQDMPSFVFCNEARAGYPAGQTPLKFGERSVFEAQMAEFVRAIRLRRPPSRCTIADSVRLMNALKKIKYNGDGNEHSNGRNQAIGQ